MNRPLKLALVTRRYPPLIGGAEKVLSYLAEALAAEGADVTVLTSQDAGVGAGRPRGRAGHDRASKRQGQVARGRLTVVRLETSRLRFWGTWLYMRNLDRWFRENPIDLAYVSMLKHDAYAVIGAGRRLGFPVVFGPRAPARPAMWHWQSWGNFGRRIGRRCRGPMRSSRSPSPSSMSCERPGARERCGLRGGENGSIALRRHHGSWRSPTGFRFRRSAWQRRPDWRAAPARSSSAGWRPKRGWTR